ncbi:nitrous oxidase accessory protein, partial [filamentous cyanobacterium CCP5]
LEPITRAEVAALVYQGLVIQAAAPAIAAEELVPPAATQGGFADVSGHWAAPFIDAIAQQNWISGFEDGSFRPDFPMTRAEYAALLVKAFDPQPQRSPQAFSDVPSGHWGHAAISQAYQAGFLSGFPDGTFAPNHPMVRVQAWVSLVSGLHLEPPAATAVDPLAPFADAVQIPAYARAITAQAIRLGLVTTLPNQPRLYPNQVASRADIVAAVYQALVFRQRLPAVTSPYVV